MENQFPSKNPFHFSHKDKIDELDVVAFDQKIKKIHKKKYKENYKNIELIQNIYDAPIVDNNNNDILKNLDSFPYATKGCSVEDPKGPLTKISKADSEKNTPFQTSES